MDTAPEPADHTEMGYDLGRTLFQVSAEITEAAGHCTALQASISTLLDKLDHPDLGAEIHMLQEVDRLQQTLADIAGLLDVAARAGDGRHIPRDAAGRALRLESLRRRFGWSGGDDGSDPVGNDPFDVDWL